MKSAKNIERLISKINVTPAGQSDEKLNDILTAQEESKITSSAESEPNIWRIIMTSKITKFATAAVVIMLAVIGIWFLQGIVENGTGPGGNDIIVKDPGGQLIAKSPVVGNPNENAEPDKKLLTLKDPSDTTSVSVLVKANMATTHVPTSASKILSMGTTAPTLADIKRVKDEARNIQEMAAAADIEGLIKMLSSATFRNKITAAVHLGRIGDERALPELRKFKKRYICGLSKDDATVFRKDAFRCRYNTSSGAFAVAISKISTRDLSEKEQIDSLFELLDDCIEPDMADPNKPYLVLSTGPKGLMDIPINEFGFGSLDLGKRVAAELKKYKDPSIVTRLRKTENKGAAIAGVWMEIQDMPFEKGIERCVEIAKNENEGQQYGAIKCLGKLGEDAISALDELAGEGHYEAMRTLGYLKNNPEVMKIICRHLTINETYLVRLLAISQLSHFNIVEHQQPVLLDALVKALNDPEKAIRRRAAHLLRSIAKGEKWSELLKYEDDLTAALKHPDKEVRGFSGQTLKILNSKLLDEK